MTSPPGGSPASSSSQPAWLSVFEPVATVIHVCEDLGGKYDVPIPRPMLMTYDVTQPYAIFMTFDGNVTWMLSRDLMYEATFEPCGIGDVVAGPLGPDLMSILLRPPRGRFRFMLARQELLTFLERTHGYCAFGAESAHYDLDKEAEQLFKENQ